MRRRASRSCPRASPATSSGRFSAAGARLFRLRSAHARLTSRDSRPSAALRRRLRRRRTRARRRLRARRVPLLLREAGIAAVGVDQDADMVELCRSQELAVEREDALAYLERLRDDPSEGSSPPRWWSTCRRARSSGCSSWSAQSSVPAGSSSPRRWNLLSFVALKNYFADLTHAQPLVPETLVMLARQAGFSSTEVRFLTRRRSRSGSARSRSLRSRPSTRLGSPSKRTSPA